MPLDKKLLNALLALDVSGKPAPTGSSNDFANYMLPSGLGVPKANKRELGLASQANEDTRSTLSKTFGWLSSLGSGVENVFMQGMEGGSLGEAFRDAGAALTHAVQPIIDLGPIPTPWEDKVSDFTYKYNVQHEGKGPISGARILEDLGVDNNVAKYGGGFAIDVLSDPLTYVGGLGILGKGKSAKAAVESVGSKATGKAHDAIEAGKKAAEESFFARPAPVAAPKSFETLTKPGVVPEPIKATVQTPKQFDPLAELELSRILPDNFVPKTTRPVNVEGLGKELNFGQREVARKAADSSTDILHKGKINPFAVKEATESALLGQSPRMAPSLAPAGGRAAEVATEYAEKLSAANRVTKLDPANQANLYNKMFELTKDLPEIGSKFKGRWGTKEAMAWRRQTALGMVKVAENNLATKGIHGVHWNGEGIRLTDIISELGQDSLEGYIPQIMKAYKSGDLTKIKEPVVRAAVEQAIGKRAAYTGTVAKTMYEEFAKNATAVENFYNPVKYADWSLSQYKKYRANMRVLGLTAKEQDKVIDLLKNHYAIDDIDALEPLVVLDTIGGSLAHAVLNGTVDAKGLNKIGKAVSKQIGAKPGEISLDLLQNKVSRWFDTNMTTWRGRGFMMPTLRTGVSSGQLWAKARADWIGKIMKDYSHEEIDMAWARFSKPLNDVEGAVFDPKIEDLAQKFRDYEDSMFASARTIDRPEILKHSMSATSQMTMETINKHLKAVDSKWQFKPDKEGNWLDGLKHANPSKLGVNPAVFMYNVDLAVQRTHAEYNLLDMFRTEFGKAADDIGFDKARHTTELGFAQHRIPSHVKFDPEVAREFTTLIKDFEKGGWHPSTKATKMLTTALRKWKSSVTIYYPAHHIRNLVGDSWLMWVAGHNDPRVFGKAQRVIGSQRKRYAEAIGDPEIHALNKLMDPDSAGWAMTEGRNVIINKHNAGISADEIYGEMINRGLLVDASRIEDLLGNNLKVTPDEFAKNKVLDRLGKPLGGRGHNAASTVAEVREHYVRTAHMISYIEKHMGKELANKLRKETSPVRRSELMKDLLDDAALEIRKFHPDGTDMSFFEQKYLRNIIPFYSWMRKAIPLTLEAMVQRPAKITSYPRAMYAMQGMLGVSAPGGVDNPFPTDQMFPDWVVAGGIGPLGDPESENPFARWFGKLGRNQIDPFGNETGYTMIDPGRLGIPFNSIVSDQVGVSGRPEEVLKGLIDPLTPLINIPMDIMRNKTMTGAPVYGEGGDPMAYLARNIPQLAPLQRLTGFGASPQEGAEGYNFPDESLINMLTALGISGTGKYTKSAQYDTQDRRAAK